MTREIYPIPAHIICENCAYLESPKVLKGAVWCIVWHYWRFGCNELPGDRQMSEVAALRGNDWIRYEDSLKDILSQIVPELKKRYKIFEDKYKTKKRVATLGVMAWQKKAKAIRCSKGSKSLPLVDELPKASFNPIPQWVGNENPQRLLNKINNRRKEPGQTFTDKL